MRTALLLASGFCLLASLSLTACEEPSVRPTRAVASPLGVNSSEHETLSDQPAGAVGVPLITIDMPNDKTESTRVRAFGQALNPATAPSTAPSANPAQRTGTIDLNPRGTPPATQP